MAGVTEQGFVTKTQLEILEDIKREQLAEISASLDVSTESVVGQVNGIFSRHLATLWEILEICYGGFDPDRAEDDQLTSLGKLTGTERRAASYSLVEAEVVVDAGTQLLSGVHFANVLDKPNVRFTPRDDFTASSTGTHFVVFRAEESGPVQALLGTLTVIATPVVGWHSITNEADASVGHPADDDATLRERREQQLQATGSATVNAIRSDVLEVEGVEKVYVFENDTDTVDSNNLPPHSVEVLVYDGDVPAASNNEIAQAVFDSVAAGITKHGALTGTATTDAGEERTVRFSRVTLTPIYLSYTLIVDPEIYPYELGVSNGAKPVLAAAARARFDEVGDLVLVDYMRALAYQIPGVLQVQAFGMALDPSASGSVHIQLGPRQLARFDSSQISVGAFAA